MIKKMLNGNTWKTIILVLLAVIGFFVQQTYARMDRIEGKYDRIPEVYVAKVDHMEYNKQINEKLKCLESRLEGIQKLLIDRLPRKDGG